MYNSGRAGSARLVGLACHQALPLLRIRHTPCVPARTEGTGTLGTQF